MPHFFFWDVAILWGRGSFFFPSLCPQPNLNMYTTRYPKP